MIASIKGKIRVKAPKSVIIETGGVGYKVFCPTGTMDRLSEGKDVRLFTHFVLGRDKMELYGFLDSEGIELFETLNDISGVGPRSALILSSFGSLERLKEAIEAKDDNLYTQVKGIGRKKMQKIVLELTGKIKELNKKELSPGQQDEALEALVALGFSRDQAQDTLLHLSEESKSTEERVKEALKILGKNK